MSEKKLTGRGGPDRNQGRKKGSGTKVKVNVTIDGDVEAWFRALGPQARDFSKNVNKALRQHKERIDAQIRQVDEFIAEHDIPL